MLDNVVMHVVENKSSGGKKIYSSVLLRESYREGGKVKKRTIANLSHCAPEEIAALKLALRHKGNLADLGLVSEDIELEEGLSVGAVWAVHQVARRLGIEKALGGGQAAKLAFWQVIARVIHQGSRLSAVRLAQTHAACDVLQMTRGFDENDLYQNLAFLADNQEMIEQRLLSARRGNDRIELFLYDVTSSYLEGDRNFFGFYGYNRDRKKGKKQIVVGLLCDDKGDPVSVEVFDGNTQDPKTFASQVEKVARRFNCRRVTFVGDRGMIKSAQVAELPEGFHYITAITKPQIHSLMKQWVVQIGLFDEGLCEIEDQGVRYILRRNPVRADEIAASRLSKKRSIENKVGKKNIYLKEHPRAKASVGVKEISQQIKRLKVEKWLKVQEDDGMLMLEVLGDSLAEEAYLDGCYVIKTDLPREVADKQIIHDRYKDLALVEKAFRNCKTTFLELRPVHVRTEKSTRGHVLTVMLAYLIVRHMQQAWGEFDLTVEEGLKQLATLSSIELQVKGGGSCLKIPRPRKQSRELLKALDITMPTALLHRDITVVTRKKLAGRRKKLVK